MAATSTDEPATKAKPAMPPPVVKPGLAAAQPRKGAESAPQPAAKKSVDKAPAVAAKAVTRPVRLAKVDPLAPLPARHSKGLTTEK